MTTPHPTGDSHDLDLSEKAMSRDGKPDRLDRRLYMQLYVYTGCEKTQNLRSALETSGFEAVLYKDVTDPMGAGILLMSEDPGFFTLEARELLAKPPFHSLTLRHEMSMLGRTYALGREMDLKDWLLVKPKRTVLNPDWDWAIWYPLRRKSEFELLPKEEQGKILFEHAKIGMAYGKADLAHDVRLACYGLDRSDNEFVIGLVGKDLNALSRVVQEMRKTQQTARYIQSLGPFFIGKVDWQSPFGKAAEPHDSAH